MSESVKGCRTPGAAGRRHPLGRQGSDKPQGRKPRGSRLGGGAGSVYGDLTVARGVSRVAGSDGLD